MTLPGGRVEFQPENNANIVNWAGVVVENAGEIVGNVVVVVDSAGTGLDTGDTFLSPKWTITRPETIRATRNRAFFTMGNLLPPA